MVGAIVIESRRIMNPTRKALWFIESHLSRDFALDDVAVVAGVSRFHLTRGFAAATGLPVMRYARARRLSLSAHRLAAGASDILDVALAAGYASHEAFTRAFRDQFGLTPEAVRAARCLDLLTLQEPLRMPDTPAATIGTPRFETHRPLLIAGLTGRYNVRTLGGIPGQWQRLRAYLGSIPGAVPGATYGVSYNADDLCNFDYLSGVEVADFGDLPADFSRLRLGEQHYAVFTHAAHVSSIGQTISAIWNEWLPASGRKPADAPNFERMGPPFDPRTGNGGLEVWIPVHA